ncbi:hypothetical protein ACHAWO_005035 [Cyclotella atomus]|jgi:hypothetical protein|uniref:Uncharacterized protein n=1 Tax=Cyclotella atomus TaxID=382360 RepID=A0ABD3P8A9_9STRA
MCNPMDPTETKLNGWFLELPIKVKTVFEKPVEQVDIGGLSSNELASLRANDPWTYYSIPAHKSALVHDEFQVTDKTKAPVDKKQKKACIVTRKTRFSCEVYPDLLLTEVDNHSKCSEFSS